MIKHINGQHKTFADAISEVSKVLTAGVVNVELFKTDKGVGSSVTISESDKVAKAEKPKTAKAAKPSKPKK